MRFEYHNDPDATTRAFNDRGWSSVEDIGYLDEEGYLYVVDRMSHVIVTNGVTIYPQAIENLLALHPTVADVAVVGAPDDALGQRLVALVVAADAAADRGDIATDVLAHCRAHRPAGLCPHAVQVVDALPRLPTGKLLKRELRAG